jgi:hypothetical protein
MITEAQPGREQEAQAELRLRLTQDCLGFWWWSMEDTNSGDRVTAREGFSDVRFACRDVAQYIHMLRVQQPVTRMSQT